MGSTHLNASHTCAHLAPHALTDTWREAASMGTVRDDASGATVGGQVYMVGGADDDGDVLSTTERWDPSTNEWEEVTPMSETRADAAAAVLPLGDRLSTA